MSHSIVIPLMIGLCIFIAGMKVMELALHKWGGAYLQQTLEKFTKTPLHGLGSGAVMTALLQSSSAITVITIGLVNAGVLTFPRTHGIILGTNIGTSVTTELIALNITDYAVVLLLGSFTVWVISWIVPEIQSKLHAIAQWMLRLRYLSLAVCGFAAVLLGMKIMQSVGPALQSRGLFEWFIDQSSQSLLWGVIAGAALTAVIQSSSATIAMGMSLAAVQAISVELGIAIVLGANIGTCVTALLASLGGNKYGKYVAISHILLNIGGVVLFYPLIGLLHGLSAIFSTQEAAQIAHSQTLFNIITSVLALPLCYLRFFKKL